MNTPTLLALLFIATPIGVIWSGHVLTILWAWFATPIFALPALTLPQAIGLSLIASFLTHQSTKQEVKTKDYLWQLTAQPAIALLVGWIVQNWI